MHLSTTWLFPRLIQAGAALALTSAAWQVPAQTSPAKAPPKAPPVAHELQAKTLNGKDFNLAASRGKVMMVFYWSSGCSICLSHMPELRANLAGWKNKPFELVTVNVDRSMDDWQRYEQISAKLDAVRPTSVWTGKPPGGRLPLTLVLNTRGQVIARHEGRIATESWDEVAEALP